MDWISLAFSIVFVYCLIKSIAIPIDLYSDRTINPNRWLQGLYYLLLLLSLPVLWLFIPGVAKAVFHNFRLTEGILHPVLSAWIDFYPFILIFIWFFGMILIIKSKPWQPTEPRGRKIINYVLIPCLAVLSFSQFIPIIYISFAWNELEYTAPDVTEEFKIKVFRSPGKLGPVYHIWRFSNQWVNFTGVELGSFYTDLRREDSYFYLDDRSRNAEWRMEWPKEPDLLQLWKGEKRVFTFKNARLPVEDLIENRESYMVDVAAEAIEEATASNLTLSNPPDIKSATG